MRLESQIPPPCGAMASPQTVTISDLALGGATLSSERIQREIPGSGRFPGLSRYSRRDTEFALSIIKVYRFLDVAASSASEEENTNVCTDGRYRGQAFAHLGGDVAGRARVPGAHRCRHQDRAQGLDAGGVSQDAYPADLAARALGDRRHAARGQLDHARAELEAQGDPDGQGSG